MGLTGGMRAWVWTAAATAILLRLPGLTRPVRADEAGFVLVARAWHPEADSLYGPYWVDRPPLLIETFRIADALGGPLFIRVFGAVACGILVLLAARVARLVAGDRAAAWTAVAVAAISASSLIDAVAVKGELLGLPFVMASIWLALLAVRRDSAALALAAGALAVTAVGFKQNLLGGLAFGAVLLVASWYDGRIDRGGFLRLAGAALAGAAVPVLLMIGWALAAGVRLETFWYAVFGFRSDAARVIADGTAHAPAVRAGILVAVALGTGLVFVIGGFIVHIRDEWVEDLPLTAATVAVLLADTAGLVLGGSYWRDYLFPLLPGAALCAALISRHAGKRGRAMRVIITGAALSTAGFFVGWVIYNAAGLQEFDEADTGRAVAAVADPGDTLVVFGGRADVQLESGLASPYRFLWSLPMRTMDPDLDELRGVVDGARAPTWIVEWVWFRTWSSAGGARLQETIREKYVEHGTGCRGTPVFLLKGLDRPPLDPDC